MEITDFPAPLQRPALTPNEIDALRAALKRGRGTVQPSELSRLVRWAEQTTGAASHLDGLLDGRLIVDQFERSGIPLLAVARGAS